MREPHPLGEAVVSLCVVGRAEAPTDCIRMQSEHPTHDLLADPTVLAVRIDVDPFASPLSIAEVRPFDDEQSTDDAVPSQDRLAIRRRRAIGVHLRDDASQPCVRRARRSVRRIVGRLDRGTDVFRHVPSVVEEGQRRSGRELWRVFGCRDLQPNGPSLGPGCHFPPPSRSVCRPFVTSAVTVVR